MELEHRISLGNRAQEVLDNEAFNEAFDLIKDEVMQQWESSPARDIEGREKLWLMLSMLKKVRQTIQSTMETGKLAKLELDHKRSLLERARDAIT